MSALATSSSTDATRKVIGAALLLLAALVPGHAAAQVLTQDEALRLAFPAPLVVERHTAYLDDAQLARARAAAGNGVEIEHGVVSYYVASRDSRSVAVAYFDAHRVRTLPEVLMIVVDRSNRIQRIEVLKFSEPPEYRASERWLEQIEGKALTPDLSLARDIVNMTGATLTANAVTRAARRVLALHTLIAPFAGRS